MAEQAKQRIAFALRNTGGTKTQEISKKLRELPAGWSVIVYRNK